ncbi:Protein CBG13413 [Caenorhabditis briggsae]|uniref:Protein CBG13413 n=1 Tax=Caenorhabditis briggsae TaxID=6238 RepID=A8XHT8_CAEBR|nr:Protein CBG13413 [Caenorhabditis briggsae]CAP32204.2 Protein CBG13413 [Caenorhabditis briggsae]
MVPAKHIFEAFSWTINSIFLLIFPWILTGCFGKQEKEEAPVAAAVPTSCSDTTSRTSVQLASSALLQPAPLPPVPSVTLPEPQKSKKISKIPEEKQNVTTRKSPDKKSKEKTISPKKSMEKAKSPRKEIVLSRKVETEDLRVTTFPSCWTDKDLAPEPAVKEEQVFAEEDLMPLNDEGEGARVGAVGDGAAAGEQMEQNAVEDVEMGECVNLEKNLKFCRKSSLPSK